MRPVCSTDPGTEIAVEFRVQPKRTIISGLSVLTATLMLNASAHAASTAVYPCEQVGRDLQSLEVPVGKLTLAVVDHVPSDPAAIDEQSVITDSVAPILYLTPRVTNIVDDVFRDASEKLPQETPEQPSSSPFAGSDEKSDPIEALDGESEAGVLPPFQRQMLRTDI